MGKSSVYASIVRALPIVPFLSFGLILAWSQFANNAYGVMGSLAAFGEGYRFANMSSTLANALALLVSACLARRADRVFLSPRFGVACGAVASAASTGALVVSVHGAHWVRERSLRRCAHSSPLRARRPDFCSF